MKDKKYLDKVLGYMVKGTKIDYENKEVNTPFSLYLFTFSLNPLNLIFPPPTSILSLHLSFSSYCRNYFGLTKDEIRYIWKEYRNIIKDKIENEG